MNATTTELSDILRRVRAAGLKLFVHDADGMVYSLVIAPTAEEARQKVLDARTGDKWDSEKESVVEIDGGIL